MALTAYQTALQNLLQAPSSPVPLISTAQLTTYINTARNQVAADAECIRFPATLTLSSGNPTYVFGSILVNSPNTLGAGLVITVRNARIDGAALEIRTWEWYAAYYQGPQPSGTPVRCAQQGQGVNGTLAFNPTPNATFTVDLDCCFLPIALVDDTTVEAIPVLWTDAVPYYAAWLAMQSLQRQADANTMLDRYNLLIRRGRQLATPSELPDNLPGGRGAQLAAARQTLAMPAPQGGGR